jgi:hypothetical protein
VLGSIFEPKREKQEDKGENYIIRSLIVCIALPDIVRMIKSRRRDGQDMYHVWEK